ncbi:MAG: FliH/SctL family protein [Dehalococcoidia bacterium]
MSSARPHAGIGRFLRATRLGGAVTLGVDGRPCEPDDPLSGIVGGSPEETAEAGTIVEQARRHAEDLVRDATFEADSIRMRAEQAGRRQGYDHGAAQARGELAEALALVQRMAAQGKAVRDELLWRSEHEMVEMVLAGVRSIVGDLAIGPDVGAQTVRRALERAGAQNVVRIRVHPQDADDVLASMARATGEPPPFEVLRDAAVGVGGCVVDTAHGRVDARLDAQLDAIARLLRDALPAAGLRADDRDVEEAADAA